MRRSAPIGPRLLLHHLESSARDQLGDTAAELGARARVAAAREHERRGHDLGQVVGSVMFDEGVEVALWVLCLLLVRKREHLVDELVDRPFVVRPRGVDVEEEAL